MTINVVCRRDAINRNRLAPLALVFTHDRRRKFVGLGISEALVHWDFDKQQPTADCPDRAEIQFQITSKIREYEKKIKKLEVLEIPVTFDTLFEQNGKRINCTVGEYFKQIIERLEKVEKYSSASKHKVTLVLVSQFRSVNMRFDELDLTYLREFEIFLSQKGNVNNSCNYAAFQYCRLYLIEILHQTTTHCKCIQFTLCCILSKFYIKPQPTPAWTCNHAVVSYRNSTSNHNMSHWRATSQGVVSYRNSTSNHNAGTTTPNSALLYLIEILHQTTTAATKHNLAIALYLIEILHQTTTIHAICRIKKSCILSKFYIKPQLFVRWFLCHSVVSYRNSTSNHNISISRSVSITVVSYRNSTSNHNLQLQDKTDSQLYLIEILHQTTTSRRRHKRKKALYLIEILHQTTTCIRCALILLSCILSKFYIKPQRPPTCVHPRSCCILSKFYIKPQLRLERELSRCSCILSKFYIKPQLVNDSLWFERSCILSKFYIKPQPPLAIILPPPRCILSKFYIKPQRGWSGAHWFTGCILSKFYIKPQLEDAPTYVSRVVSYRNSTSNHNPGRVFWIPILVVSYRNSTSNHNQRKYNNKKFKVVSYRNSTSNHNGGSRYSDWLEVVSYRNSTSNHNISTFRSVSITVVSYRNSTSNHNNVLYNTIRAALYLIEILHQTTTTTGSAFSIRCCILSKFYIKPQLQYSVG